MRWEIKIRILHDYTEYAVVLHTWLMFGLTDEKKKQHFHPEKHNSS